MAEGEVEVLQRLRRRALEQVVEGGHDHQPAAVGGEGEAADLDAVIAEVAAARQTERGSRADDRRSETAMEDRKKEGYF